MSPQNQTKAYQLGSKQSYQHVPQPGSPTYTEAWALIEAARRMAVAIEINPADDLKSRNAIRETVRLNWRLWTIFQAELTVGNSQVPDDLRENMLTLCKFVDNHTVETMSNLTPENIAVLIDLNRNIASGLLDSLEEATDGADTDQAEDASEGEETPPEPGSINQEV